MALAHDVNLMSIPAGADLSGALYHFVKLASDGECILTSTAGEAAIGINYSNTPDAAADIASIRPLDGGIALVESSATITAGDYVSTNNAGEARVAITGDIPLGVALESSVDGQVMRIITINMGAIIA